MNDGEIKNHAALLCSTYAMEHSSSINHMPLKLLTLNRIDDDTFLQSLIGHDMSRWMNRLPPRHIVERTMWVLIERVKEKETEEEEKETTYLEENAESPTDTSGYEACSVPGPIVQPHRRALRFANRATSAIEECAGALRLPRSGAD